MSAARALTDEDRAFMLALADAIVDRVEARLRHQRPKGQRRQRAPALVAAIAAEARTEPVDEVAAAKARSALGRLRDRTGK